MQPSSYPPKGGIRGGKVNYYTLKSLIDKGISYEGKYIVMSPPKSALLCYAKAIPLRPRD